MAVGRQGPPEAGRAGGEWLTAPPADAKTPDGQLHRKLTGLNGPLFGRIDGWGAKGGTWGVDPSLFGKHPTGDGMVSPPACA